jgi:hypothetical protein
MDEGLVRGKEDHGNNQLLVLRKKNIKIYEGREKKNYWTLLK